MTNPLRASSHYHPLKNFIRNATGLKRRGLTYAPCMDTYTNTSIVDKIKENGVDVWEFYLAKTPEKSLCGEKQIYQNWHCYVLRNICSINP